MNMPLRMEYTSYVAHNIFKVDTTSPNPSQNMIMRPNPSPLGHIASATKYIHIMQNKMYVYMYVCMYLCI